MATSSISGVRQLLQRASNSVHKQEDTLGKCCPISSSGTGPVAPGASWLGARPNLSVRPWRVVRFDGWDAPPMAVFPIAAWRRPPFRPDRHGDAAAPRSWVGEAKAVGPAPGRGYLPRGCPCQCPGAGTFGSARLQTHVHLRLSAPTPTGLSAPRLSRGGGAHGAHGARREALSSALARRRFPSSPCGKALPASSWL